MSYDSNVLDAVVRSLEIRLEESEHRLSSLSDEITQWRRQAHAHCPSCGSRSLQARKPTEKLFGELALPEAAMLCLSEYDYPISGRTLRLKLEEMGYPKKKLGQYGNYLHTVICRLVEAKKIQRLEGDEIIAI
jgi:hypothetical protein